ncbi:short-chain dehydrogenase [Streptomyces sp. AS58]|uniref:SDR family NAD(P)-dependent oxidoreductase n=1 Tax=Streptomyces sp. AS58 TaxID=1519489 RepID=UPI0006AECFEA|nr:SDR family NAD(P)-dependent oxidoreductase [Streptomyces sp. AS58]KOV54424.1 short-chain dehydrogenase [Streptomyces sp. AS58]
MPGSSLSSRTVLVTGASTGVGVETARRLTGRGATVLMHGRTAEEARAAADMLVATKGVDAERLCTYGADFARLDEIEFLAHKVMAEHPDLNVLVNNAAMAAPERHTVTDDGNEIALQVNFLAPYLLTCLLAPALAGGPGGRVVDVSSSPHGTAPIQWADPHRARRYSRLAAHARSRLTLTVFAADPRVTAVSVHPGASPAQGARHVVRLCDPAVEIVDGAHYDGDARDDLDDLGSLSSLGERVALARAATEDRTTGRPTGLGTQGDVRDRDTGRRTT